MTLDDWLAPRLLGAPPELASAVRELIAEVDPDPTAEIPASLAAAALRGFEGVLEDPEPDRGSRRAALRLLAADASLTYAFEAAADLRTGALELADRLGPAGVLGRAFERATGPTVTGTPSRGTPTGGTR